MARTEGLAGRLEDWLRVFDDAPEPYKLVARAFEREGSASFSEDDRD